MNKFRWAAMLLIECSAACVIGCGDDSNDSADAAAGSGGNAAEESSQTPPQGAEALEAWLEAGSYKKWHCEDKVHASRDPSPHGFNRICSNDLIADHATETSDWPEGAAAVKELFTAEDASEPMGYSVYLKTKKNSAGGASWYWYERLPLASAPPDSNGVVADGFGDTGPAQSICVGCHVAAGSDKAHTPSEGGRDQVYTPVP